MPLAGGGLGRPRRLRKSEEGVYSWGLSSSAGDATEAILCKIFGMFQVAPKVHRFFYKSL